MYRIEVRQQLLHKFPCFNAVFVEVLFFGDLEFVKIISSYWKLGNHAMVPHELCHSERFAVGFLVGG